MCKKSIVNAPRTLPISSPLKKKKKKNFLLVLHCILSSGFVLLIKIKHVLQLCGFYFLFLMFPFIHFSTALLDHIPCSVGKNIFRYQNNHVTFKSIFDFGVYV